MIFLDHGSRNGQQWADTLLNKKHINGAFKLGLSADAEVLFAGCWVGKKIQTYSNILGVKAWGQNGKVKMELFDRKVRNGRVEFSWARLWSTPDDGDWESAVPNRR